MATTISKDVMDVIPSLDEAEFLTYVTLLSRCTLTLDEISLRLTRPIEDAQSSLNRLVKNGLVTALHQTVPAYCAKQPYRNIADQLELVRDREVKIKALIDDSPARIVDCVSEEIRNLLDLAPAQDAELSASLENAVSQNKKELEEIKTESTSSLNDKIKILRRSLDETANRVSTSLDVGLNKTKATISDAAKDLTQDLAASPSPEIIEQSNVRLSASIRKVEAVSPKMLEGITACCDGLAKQMTEFKTAATNLLSKLRRTAKAVERLQKIGDTSLNDALKQVKLTLSSSEATFSETIGIGPETDKGKLSVQEVLTDAQRDAIGRATANLDRIPPAYARLVERTQKTLDNLVSDLKAQTTAFFKTNLDLTAPNSKIAKQLHQGLQSLRDEVTKIADVPSQEILALAGDTRKICEFQGNLMVAVQSFTDNVRSATAKVVRALDESTNLTEIKEQVTRIEEYSKQISTAETKSDPDLNDSLTGILEQIDRFEERNNTALSATVKALESVAKNLHDKNIDVPELSDLATHLQAEIKDLGQLKKETRSKLSAAGSQMIASSIRLATESLKTAQSILARLGEETASLPRKIEASARDSVEAIQKMNAEMREELEPKKAQCEEIEHSVEGARMKIARVTDEHFTSVEKSLGILEEEMSKAIIVETGKTEASSDDTIKTMKEYLAESMTMISSVITAERTNIEGIPGRVKVKLSESLAATQESISGSINEATGLSTKTIEEARRSIDESVASTISEIDDAVSTVEEGLTKLVDENNGALESKKTEFIKVENASEKETDKAMTEILDLMNFLKAVLGKKEASLTEKVAILAAKMNSAVAELVTNTGLELLKSSEQLKTRSSELILKSAEEFSGSLMQLSFQQANSVKEVLTRSTTSYGSKMIRPLEKLKKSITQQVTDIASAIAPIADEAEKITAMNAKTIMKLAQSISTTPRVPIAQRTWQLSSRRGITEHLKGMVERAQTTVFVEAPASSYLPPAKEFSKRKEVLFYIQVGETARTGSGDDRMTDARSEDNLASLKTLPNVRLITEPRRPYIVVNRDNAEILAGAENQSGEKIDATAIVSEESAYVGLVRELIGPSLLSDT